MPITAPQPRPTISEVWANAGINNDPAGKVPKGWIYGEKPPFAFLNFLQNQTDKSLVHIYEYGIPLWDLNTTYQRGSRVLYYDGIDTFLYKWRGGDDCLNIEPTTDLDWVLDEASDGTMEYYGMYDFTQVMPTFSPILTTGSVVVNTTPGIMDVSWGLGNIIVKEYDVLIQNFGGTWDHLKSALNYNNLEELGLTDASLTNGDDLASFTTILDAMPLNSILRMDYDGTASPNLGSVTMYGGGILEVQKAEGTTVGVPNNVTNTFINTSSNGNGQAFAQIDNLGLFVGWDWNLKSDDLADFDAKYVDVLGDTMIGALNVPAGAVGTEVPQVQEVVQKVGDTMTGPLEVPALAVGAEVPQVQEVVQKTGDTMTGELIIPVAAPSADEVAANKKYVDDQLTSAVGGAGIVASVSDDGLGDVVVDNTDAKNPIISVTVLRTAIDLNTAHLADVTNPHLVTKAQINLNNVDNTADLDKPISTAAQTAIDFKANGSALNGTFANPTSITILDGVITAIS